MIPHTIVHPDGLNPAFFEKQASQVVPTATHSPLLRQQRGLATRLASILSSDFTSPRPRRTPVLTYPAYPQKRRRWGI